MLIYRVLLVMALVGSISFAAMPKKRAGKKPVKKTVLQYPLVLEVPGKEAGDYGYILASSFNKKLKALPGQDLAGFPDSISLTSRTQAQKLVEHFAAYSEKAIEALKLGDGTFLKTGSLSAVTGENLAHRLCYSGKPEAAVSLLNGLTDSVVSDQHGMIAWKTGTKEVVSDEIDTEESPLSQVLGEDFEMWQEFKGATEGEILFVWHESDGGEDVNFATIPKCAFHPKKN
ncbi:MAG: hypothetical protein HYR96_11800 [Deltaproteobacteria bacterium]|nr:hypothetical protein [Deltaproteobacteria bacterium]MBI3293714.1 hypothetical protein [Deltaproteobacteria bacterium]